jgi:trehalose synthase
LVLKEGCLTDVAVEPVTLGLFKQVLSPAEYRDLAATIVEARVALEGRTIWNVNSTARGGGVAELLESLVAYARGAGIDTRWVVIQGTPDFFRVTKRIHNQIQGFPGDGGELGPAERDAYESALEPAAFELSARLRRGDVVLLHDPQTAGLAPKLKSAGVSVIWRCHVGMDSPNELAVRAWEFLRPYLATADAYVFSRASFAWQGLEQSRVNVIAPSIDPFTPKNNLLPPSRAAAILISAGVLGGYAAEVPYFMRRDGSAGMVGDRAEVLQAEPLLPSGRFVTQVSRWDRLKDPLGVMRGFVDHVPARTRAHLVLAGPQPGAVTDDPEGASTYEEIARAWRDLTDAERRRVHVASLPMRDLEQNAAIVNALQTNAAVVVQKSLAEGFGLTVAEAMWKAHPVVASRVGGIQEQIEDGTSGVLLDDPTDLEAMGRAVTRLLDDPARAAAMGKAAQERVRRQFLSNRHLQQYAELLSRLPGSPR